MTYRSEKIIPYKSSRSKTEQVAEMFDSIADGYDRLNRMMSLGFDKSWRKDAIRRLGKYNPERILDIATGTGDFAIQSCRMLNPKTIVGIDISDGMMDVGRAKVRQAALDNIISFEQQDCAAMTFADNQFDAATVAFGVRNFEDIDKSFNEIRRTLRTGGVFVFLELSVPQRFPMKQLYAIYSSIVIPTMGRIFSADSKAYNYLPESIKAFPQGKEMIDILTKNGFKNVQLITYTGGVCSLYIAQK